MRKTESLTWDEVYDHWRICSLSGPKILQKPIAPVEIPVKWEDSGCFYGMDWLSHNEFERRKKTIETDLIQFLYFTKPTNKGTIHTLNMLTEAKNEEERAAIWLYAYGQDILDMCGRSDMHRYARLVCDAAWQFLAPKFDMWHHAMKRLVPQVFAADSMLSETQFASFEPFVELARLNAAVVLHEYVPVLYTSLEPGMRKDEFTVRSD